MSKKVYVTAPRQVWSTDRYEELIYLIYHHWPSSSILERRDLPDIEPGSDEWHERLKGVAQVVFIRDSERCIDLLVWDEINAAQAAGRTVHLARQHSSGTLILEPWRGLSFTVQDDGCFKVGYAKPAKKREKVEAKG